MLCSIDSENSTQPWHSHKAKPNDHLFCGESLHLFLAPLIQCFSQVCQEALEGTESRVVSTNSNGSQILKTQQNSVKSYTTTLHRRMMNMILYDFKLLLWFTFSTLSTGVLSLLPSCCCTTSWSVTSVTGFSGGWPPCAAASATEQ
jgi:hypothetical protein